MTTWHQERALELNPNPLSHPTLWRVIENSPGRMMCSESFATHELAYENMMKAPNRYMLEPRSVTAKRETPTAKT